MAVRRSYPSSVTRLPAGVGWLVIDTDDLRLAGAAAFLHHLAALAPQPHAEALD